MDTSKNRSAGDYIEPVTVRAHSNIALIKYWGKRSKKLNLPAVGSISMTLDALHTVTTLQFDPSLSEDRLVLDGLPVGDQQLNRVSRFLDILAENATRPPARIESRNNFPTGAGLASSASGFAALAKAALHALNRDSDAESVSRLARRGSCSAARSVFGGFVEMKCGDDESGDNDYALQLYPEDYWDICLVIAVTSAEKKRIGSSAGMTHTAETAPYYNSWVHSSEKDVYNMRKALAERNFDRVGELAEHSCFKMHGLMMSAQPPMLYLNSVTVESIHAIWELRRQGFSAYVTIDAGPQVKVLCKPKQLHDVSKILGNIDGMQEIIVARPGPGISILEKTK